MGKTILVVDDSASMRQVVGMALKGGGYEVIEACDGKDALSKLGGQKVHLVISDVNMPSMDGIGLVARLRACPSYRLVPIVMLTTESSVEMKQRARAAGATGWIVKPFDPTKLIDAIERVTA